MLYSKYFRISAYSSVLRIMHIIHMTMHIWIERPHKKARPPKRSRLIHSVDNFGLS